MVECFLNLPDEECYLYLPDKIIDHPLDMENIKESQTTDKELQKQAQRYSDHYTCKCVSAVDDVLCYIKPGDLEDSPSTKVAETNHIMVPPHDRTFWQQVPVHADKHAILSP